jgi:streptogramin lyase
MPVQSGQLLSGREPQRPVTKVDPIESSKRVEATNAEKPDIWNFSIPTPGAHPGSSLVEDNHGRIWFPLILANKVATFDRATKQYHDFEMPSDITMPVKRIGP